MVHANSMYLHVIIDDKKLQKQNRYISINYIYMHKCTEKQKREEEKTNAMNSNKTEQKK